MKQCSACHGVHVSRSKFKPGERASHPFQSPYHCADCGARFWVLSRVVRMRAVTTALIFAIAVMISTGFLTLMSTIGSGTARDSTTAEMATSTNVSQMGPVSPPASRTSSARP